MIKLLSGLSTLSLLFTTTALLADEAKPADDPQATPQATPKDAKADQDAKADPPKPRPTTVDLSLFWVPWGMHYTRAALGASLAYKTPLVRKPGILWDTTNVSAGVRNLYGFVNNSLTAFVEITPIAVFKLNVQAAYDVLIVNPFNGGLRTLTPAGAQRLKDGDIERESATSIDWVTEKGGLDNFSNFRTPIGANGMRLRVLPTLQGKVGPIAVQYNFGADWNLYSTPGLGNDTIYHDTFTFTLRKLHDFSHAHELVVAYNAPIKAPGELLLGVTTRYQHVVGTGLSQLTMNALLFARYPKKIWGNRVSPFAAANVGTNLIDPMWQYAFSWVLVLGADFNLYTSKSEKME